MPASKINNKFEEREEIKEILHRNLSLNKTKHKSKYTAF
jgi:hypothetical protein